MHQVARKITQNVALALALSSCLQAEDTPQLLVNWQAAYLIDDASSHLKIAQDLFEKTPSAFHASLYLQSLSKNGEIEKATTLLQGPYKIELIQQYPDSLRDFAWEYLYTQMQGASVDQVSLILQLLHLVHDRHMSTLVLEALSHDDLRVSMRALDLVESYPLDVYRNQVLELWRRSSNTLMRARIFSLAARLKWKEAEEMEASLQNEASSLERELIIPLADYEMVKNRLDIASLQSMAAGNSIVPVRMAAWCLRYQHSKTEGIAKVYTTIFDREDSLASLLAIDTLLHFHRDLYLSLEKELEKLQKTWTSSLIDYQVSWVRALALGPKERVEWVKKHLNREAGDRANSQLAWALASRFEDPNLISYIWSQRGLLKEATQLQTAWAIVQTRSLHQARESQEAIKYVSDWILNGPDYWSQDSDWPGLIQLRDKAPSWMSNEWIRESALELRLSVLSDLSLTESEKAYEIIVNLYKQQPDIYLPALMALAWSQGRSLDTPALSGAKEARLIRALTCMNLEDKQGLQKEFFTSSDPWKQQIMDAMLQLADQNDLEFFASCLNESTRLSIKSASGILIALRQGTRAKNTPSH